MSHQLKENSLNQKGYPRMKISTLNTVISTLTAIAFDNAEVMADLTEELSKAEAADARAKERTAAKVAEYEAVKPIVFGALSETPITLAEMWESIADEVPKGFTKGKLSYALRALWGDEVVKTEGKVNSYSVKE